MCVAKSVFHGSNSCEAIVKYAGEERGVRVGIAKDVTHMRGRTSAA
jgi:hypothetical protein